MGIIDMEGGLGRIYGAMGIGVEEPFLDMEIRESESVIINAPEEFHSVIANVISGIGAKVRIDVDRYIGRHKGLGATTQTILTTATGILKLLNKEINTDEIAYKFGRGRISRIGIEVFKQGGFILDAPRRIGEQINKTILRIEFPKNWLVVLGIPKEIRGLDEEEEKIAFNRLPKPSRKYPERISHLILVKLIPALLDNEIYEFGEALTEIQQLIGEVFKPVQGDVIANPISRKVIDVFSENNLVGLGQSSWGPTVYGFTPSMKTANEAMKAVKETFQDKVDVIITRGRNEGAVIEMLE